MVDASESSLIAIGHDILQAEGEAVLRAADTLASTGTPSHFLHPAEAMHGDLGVLRAAAWNR